MAAESGTQSIDRAAELLVSVVESLEPRVGRRARRAAGLPKSTTSRLVGALERQGLVQRTARRPSAPGPGAAPVRAPRRARDLVALAAPRLARLADAPRRDGQPRRRRRRRSRALAQEDSAHFVGGTNWVGRRVPFDARREREGLRSRSAPAPPSDGRALERSARARLRDDASTSSSPGSPPSPRPSSGRDGDASPRSRISGPDRPPDTPSASRELAPLLHRRGARARHGSATTTKRGAA